MINQVLQRLACLLVVLGLGLSLERQVRSDQKSLYFWQPASFEKDNDNAFRLPIQIESDLQVEFWFRMNDKTTPGIDEFLGLFSPDDPYKGLKVQLNFDIMTSSALPDLMTAAIDHSIGGEYDFTRWTRMIIEIGFRNLPVSSFLNSRVVLKDGAVSFPFSKLELSGVAAGDAMYLSIGSVSASLSKCTW